MTDDLSQCGGDVRTEDFEAEDIDVKAAEAYLSAIATVTVSYLSTAAARATVAGDEHGVIMRKALQRVAAGATQEDAEVLLHASAAISSAACAWTVPIPPVGAPAEDTPETGPLMVITPVQGSGHQCCGGRPAPGGCGSVQGGPPAAAFC